ncbi:MULTISPECIES: YtrH family sporulation protein [Bacillus]|uniref:YtrH family sporulation protein n=1 Tax=Bacillus TaxID=1386 RepID=UPI000312700A|nr:MULTISPECIES: YtrH family sporulation protein [Bacillus]
MKEAFFPVFINSFFIALGVILGGSLIGGLSAFFTNQPPITIVNQLSESIRIWAIIAAIGGTFDTVYSLERGILNGETADIIKQILWILSAFAGARTGSVIISWLTQGHISS